MAYDKSQNKKRNRESRKLAGEIDRFLGKIAPPSTKGHLELRQAWSRAAPEAFLSHTENTVLDNNDDAIIVVYTDSAAWAAEMGMQKEHCRLRLSEELGKEVKDIRFAVSKNKRL
jgi:hypothetical protein